MMQKMTKSERGFTIIELLIVIAIIAILAAVAIPALLKAQKSGKESAARQTIKSLQAAEEQFRTRQQPVAGQAKTYGTLDNLQTATLSDVGEGDTEPQSGYVFTSAGHSSETYTIYATPPTGAGMLAFTLSEDGRLTQGTP